MVIPANEWIKCIVDYENVPGHFVSFIVSLKMHHRHRGRHQVGMCITSNFPKPKNAQ
jgi:hypothetical protein